jgi:hypothetical protein
VTQNFTFCSNLTKKSSENEPTLPENGQDLKKVALVIILFAQRFHTFLAEIHFLLVSTCTTKFFEVYREKKNVKFFVHIEIGVERSLDILFALLKHIALTVGEQRVMVAFSNFN